MSFLATILPTEIGVGGAILGSTLFRRRFEHQNHNKLPTFASGVVEGCGRIMASVRRAAMAEMKWCARVDSKSHNRTQTHLKRLECGARIAAVF
jgi:hypothetical protein